MQAVNTTGPINLGTERSHEKKLNKNFEFDMRDIDTIEMALRRKVMVLSQKLMDGVGESEDLRAEIKEMSELLARIHQNKKITSPKGDLHQRLNHNGESALEHSIKCTF